MKALGLVVLASALGCSGSDFRSQHEPKTEATPGSGGAGEAGTGGSPEADSGSGGDLGRGGSATVGGQAGEAGVTVSPGGIGATGGVVVAGGVTGNDGALAGLGGAPAGGLGGTAGADSGSSGMGGLVGTGGVAPTCGQSVGSAPDRKIDDFEDGDGTIGNGAGYPVPPTRSGQWVACSTATLPHADSPNGSAFGMLAEAASCSFGLKLSVDFNDCGDAWHQYDASAYDGIKFWYQSTAPIRVTVPTVTNLPTAEGGACLSTDCYNHHGKNFAASAEGAWGTISWAELRGSQEIGDPLANPQIFGVQRQFDAAVTIGLSFQSEIDDAELWVDDLSFL